MVSEYLKNQTRAQHDALEEKFESSKIFDKTFALEDYKKIIWYNYLFLLNLEQKTFEKISAELASKLQLNNRYKLPLIEQDVENLGFEKVAPNQENQVTSSSEALGILYVMEGSTLGGNVMRKQLAANPEFQNIFFSYFGCYGDETGAKWKTFKEVLNAEITPDHYQEVLKGAENAYRFLLNLFD